MRVLIWILGGVVIVVATPFAMVGMWSAYGHWVGSPTYAKRYFDGLIPVEGILASRSWHFEEHPWSADGCTFAIARLPKGVASTPPEPRYADDWQFVWGGDWMDTPLPSQVNASDILDACIYLWPAELGLDLIAARDTPGAFAARRSIDTLFLYDPNRRLAARVRFGD